MTDAVVTEAVERSRFEIHLGDELAGFADYVPVPGGWRLPHTVVEPRFGGRGLASRLIAETLDVARARQLTVVPACSFVAAFIGGHPEYLDLVAPEVRARYGLADPA